jgi:hypothetical protein
VKHEKLLALVQQLGLGQEARRAMELDALGQVRAREVESEPRPLDARVGAQLALLLVLVREPARSFISAELLLEERSVDDSRENMLEMVS